MTLAEFLLARIAEDEARAEFVQRQLGDNPWVPADPWLLSWHDEYDLLCIEPSRALAECEAKRRIVEHLGWIVDNEDRNIVERNVLRLLALPYADHPDYREEWRP